MGALKSTMRRIPAGVRAVLALALGWGFSVGILDRHPFWIRNWLDARGWPNVENAYLNTEWMFRAGALDPLLFLASALVPAALLVRMIARARVRAGLPDPLDRVRGWTAAHRKLTTAALAVPALGWFANPTRHVVMGIIYAYGVNIPPLADILSRLGHPLYVCMELFSLAMAVTSVGVFAGARIALRAFLSPTVALADVAPASQPDDRVGFDAVAVTKETRMAVALMAALSVAAVVTVQSASLLADGVQAALAAYVAVAIAGVVAFRRASRVAVGADGVFVTGTSRSRFFAYKDLDSVRASGSDIELVRKGRVTLRLQLHGEDATHKTAIVARIGEAIDTVKAGGTAAVGDLVGSASDDELARLAEGTRGYRTQSVTREQLWSVVEGPEHDAATRTAAARALASTGVGDKTQNVRLRVAAEKSAEPGVRVALESLLDENEETIDDPEVPAGLAVARVRG